MRTTFTKINKNNCSSGFTLIEILIVIAIIAVLAVILALNLDSAQARSRDARRKSDLNTIAQAVRLYREDSGTFQICGGSTGRQCGYDGGGSSSGWGFFNLDDSGGENTYGPKSINQVLIELGYLSGTVIDPTGGKNWAHYYMYYTNLSGFTDRNASVFAMLEQPSPEDEQTVAASVYPGINAAYSNVGINYADTIIP